MPRAFQCDHEKALVLLARAGNPAGDNASLLGDKPLQAFLVLVIDIVFFIIAEAAGAAFANLSRSARSTRGTGSTRSARATTVASRAAMTSGASVTSSSASR